LAKYCEKDTTILRMSGTNSYVLSFPGFLNNSEWSSAANAISRVQKEL